MAHAIDIGPAKMRAQAFDGTCKPLTELGGARRWRATLSFARRYRRHLVLADRKPSRYRIRYDVPLALVCGCCDVQQDDAL